MFSEIGLERSSLSENGYFMIECQKCAARPFKFILYFLLQAQYCWLFYECFQINSPLIDKRE